MIPDAFQTIDSLLDQPLVEVELMLTPDELKIFGSASLDSGMKFNDWIRYLAYKALEKKAQP